ncbi:HEPN domain-containing protein [Paenibacillus alkaliterrae]|uniref:HEPN domain-containing protein n=1 Tax=Paenibacillus alkaliterrae TaxID=320909 RepID=UPI0038B30E06
MLKKSEGSFQSAKTDIENQIYDRALSSLYYSAFQAVTAYMLHDSKPIKATWLIIFLAGLLNMKSSVFSPVFEN